MHKTSTNPKVAMLQETSLNSCGIFGLSALGQYETVSFIASFFGKKSVVE